MEIEEVGHRLIVFDPVCGFSEAVSLVVKNDGLDDPTVGDDARSSTGVWFAC